MTPVEKANDLVNKMFNCDKATPEESMAMLYPHALQCALIAVNEMMHQIRFYLAYGYEKQLEYWNEVKHELEYMYTKQLTK